MSGTTFTLVAADEARPTVRDIAAEALEEGLDETDALVRIRSAVRTPEDFARWAATLVASPQTELEAATYLNLETELPDLADQVEHQLNEGWAKLSALEDAVRQAAVAAGLPLVITTEAGRVIALDTRELVMALGEAARREREEAEAASADRWPTVAECAMLLAAWLPEASAIDISLDGDGAPAAIIELPELMVPMVWQAQCHAVVYPHPLQDREASLAAQALWDERWAALYAGRATRPAAVWRWRVGRAS